MNKEIIIVCASLILLYGYLKDWFYIDSLRTGKYRIKIKQGRYYVQYQYWKFWFYIHIGIDWRRPDSCVSYDNLKEAKEFIKKHKQEMKIKNYNFIINIR